MKILSNIKLDFFSEALIQAVNNNKDLIPELITQRLYNEGVDSKDRQLQTDVANEQNQAFYSKFTQGLKQAKGQKISNVTLKDSGDFYNSVNVDTEKDTIIINADMQKDNGHMSDNFMDMYGSEQNFIKSILNLNEDDRKVFKREIIKDFVFQYKRLISNTVRQAKML